MVKNVPCFFPYFDLHVGIPSALELGYFPLAGFGAVQVFEGSEPGFVEPLTITSNNLPGQNPAYTAALSLVTRSIKQMHVSAGFNYQSILEGIRS